MKQFKAGQYMLQGGYKAFIPHEINRDWVIDDMEILSLLSQADRELGRLDMFSEYVDIDRYIRMHLTKEASQSTRIEGTKTKIEEAVLPSSEVSEEIRNDWQEVQNYISAINHAVEQLEKLPFSTRLIKDTHKILLQGVRGKHKLPGEFRRSQNWIGGASLHDAVFIPPPAHEVPRLMSDLEKFAHNPDNPLPDLLKIALIHYQFETIHPFLDGNGRVGRLLIPLYLVDKKVLKRPILYLSDFFEKHRQLYYDNLMRVRTHNDLKQWFKFFLTGVIQTARQEIETFHQTLQLQKELDKRIKNLQARQQGNARKLLDFIYRNPVFNASMVAEALQISMATAYKLINTFEKLNIIEEFTGAKRGRLYVFKDYMKLFGAYK